MVRAQEWVIHKAKVWKKPLSAIYEMARLLDATTIDMIEKVRKGAGSRKQKKGYINLEQLKAIVYFLERKHELQKRIVQIVMDNYLNAANARVLSELVSRQKNKNTIEDILRNPLDAIELHKLEVRKSEAAPLVSEAVVFKSGDDRDTSGSDRSVLELKAKLEKTQRQLTLARVKIEQLKKSGGGTAKDLKGRTVAYLLVQLRESEMTRRNLVKALEIALRKLHYLEAEEKRKKPK